MTIRGVCVAALAALPLSAQQPHAPSDVTADDYARAERFLSANTDPLVIDGEISPRWMPDGGFWFERESPAGLEYVRVDPSTRRLTVLTTRADLAEGLAAAAGGAPAAFRVDAVGVDGAIVAEAGGVAYECRIDPSSSVVCARARKALPDAVLSPDGTRAVLIRDHDLWMREVESGAETRLTTDGREDFGYGTDNAGWVRRDRPVVRWSPDSRRIATFQHDARGVGMMYLVETEVGHPELDAWRYPLPEDSVIFRIHRVILDVEAPPGERVVRLDMPPDPHRSSVCDHVSCGGTFADVQWSADGTRLAFVSSSRDHKRATLRVANAVTGEVRDVLEERVETFFESGYRTANWRVLHETGEVIWFSQRADWGHLYLYDLDSGALKHAVTSGAWNVLQVTHLDAEDRTVTFVGNEREPGDPYFRYLYRAALDGGDPVLLTPDSADHTVSVSPDGRFIVDAHSTPVEPGVTVLRGRDGEVLMELARTDISRLVASGWRPPTPFSVKARDGETDLYGLLFRPLSFDPELAYPVINYIYPGPQTGSVGTRSFRASRRDLQSLAELGFVVVALDAMGTPLRSKSFHEAYYGDMGDNGLPDQVAGMRQLAERHSWIDLDRAGIYGHSGGGFASTAAILRYPDFFDVAVSQAGNHDNRNYEDDWGEKWHGLLETRPDGTTNYDSQANQLLAGNLEGKLLLAHGTLDDNVPPSNTLLVVDALIAANEDFDLLLLPNRRHGFGNEPYMTRRRWDYFVRHLLGAEPPEQYEIGRGPPVG